jgi:hypothetical protein
MGRRPLGDKAMTAAERQQRMRQRREDEANSLRNEIQILKDATSGRRTRIEMPPGEAADLTNAVTDAVFNFEDQIRNVFQPKYRAWLSLKPPPSKAVRTKMEVHLQVMADHFLVCCPSVQDRLDKKNALIAELVADRDARIAQLKSGEADDETLFEWLAERAKSWRPEQRREVVEQLMAGMGAETIIRWLAWLIKFIPKGKGLADFVRALSPADRKRLAAALANHSPRR